MILHWQTSEAVENRVSSLRGIVLCRELVEGVQGVDHVWGCLIRCWDSLQAVQQAIQDDL